MVDFKPHFEKMCKGLFPDDDGRWRLNDVISSEGIYWLEVTCSSFNRPEEPVRIATSGYSHQDVIACCQKENGEWSVFFHGNGWENIASIANMLNPNVPYDPHLISTVHRRRSKTYTPQEIYEFYGSTQEEVRDEFGNQTKFGTILPHCVGRISPLAKWKDKRLRRTAYFASIHTALAVDLTTITS